MNTIFNNKTIPVYPLSTECSRDMSICLTSVKSNNIPVSEASCTKILVSIEGKQPQVIAISTATEYVTMLRNIDSPWFCGRKLSNDQAEAVANALTQLCELVNVSRI